MTNWNVYPQAFHDAIDILLGSDPVKGEGEEGGYGNDPDDAGGETNFGLDKRSHPELDLKNITKAQAIAVYWQHYWLPYAPDHFADEDTKKLFDVAVNTGFRQANKFLQRAVGADDDGVIGPETIRAVVAANPHTIHLSISHQQAAFYEALAAARPSQEKFLRGWLKRAAV
jgi:lysozyme family protein